MRTILGRIIERATRSRRASRHLEQTMARLRVQRSLTLACA